MTTDRGFGLNPGVELVPRRNPSSNRREPATRENLPNVADTGEDARRVTAGKGLAEQAGSVHKVHDILALAESYRDDGPEAKHNLETILEYIPQIRRGLFLLGDKTGVGACLL